MTSVLRIAHLRIAHQGAILRWAILRVIVIWIGKYINFYQNINPNINNRDHLVEDLSTSTLAHWAINLAGIHPVLTSQAQDFLKTAKRVNSNQTAGS